MKSKKQTKQTKNLEFDSGGPFRLFYHPSSSASLRVILYLRCRQVPPSLVQLTSTEFTTDDRGIPVFTMPEGDPETKKLGTKNLLAFNPEGRIPILLLSDGRKMTQSGPIIDYIEDCLTTGIGRSLLPDDPWERAEVRRIAWIIAADTQPYQNIPFIIQAIGEWGMVKAAPLTHPLRLHFVRREFGAVESAKNVGRSPQELTCAAYLTVSIDNNVEKAQHRLDEYLQSYYGASADLLKPMMACFAGPLDAASEWLQGYTRAGASHLVLRFAGDHEQHLNMFAKLRADLGW